MAKFESTQKVTNKSGIEQEDALLNESAAKETSLNLHIMDLENEIKQVSNQNAYIYIFQRNIEHEFLCKFQLRHELDRVRNERDRMLQENSDIGRDKSDADAEKLRFKVS